MLPAVYPPPPPPAAAIAPAPAVSAVPPVSAAGSPLAAAPSQQRVDSHDYHYTVVGNHLLSAAEVRAALARGATPREAVGALKKAYERNGYFLVALVGVDHGKEVTIRVVQGRVTHVEGPKRLAAFFTGLEGDDAIRRPDVIRAGILAQAYAATNDQQPKVSFHPAPEVGGSILQVGTGALPGSDPFAASLTFGDYGNRYAGRYLAQAGVSIKRAGMTLQLNQAHALPGMATDTRGAFYRNNSASFSIVTPVGIFALDGSKTAYHLGQKFAPLFPTGRIEVFGATATQLLYADEFRRWSIHEGVHRIHDATTVFSGNFTLSDRRFNLMDAGTDFSWRFGGLFQQPAALSVSAAIKRGAAQAAWGFTRATGAPASHFNIYTANVDLTQSLAGGYGMKLELSGQATPDTLPSYEQWVLGGINNVTGWLPGTLAGDRGYLGRFTFEMPAWKPGPVQLKPGVFVEHGATRLSYIAPQAPVWQALTDVGVGLNVDVPAWHTSAILAWAKPVDSHEVPSAERHGQRSHLFFYVKADF